MTGRSIIASGATGEDPRPQLRLEVTVVDGTVRTVATLAGAALGPRERPLPFGRDEVWGLIDRPGAEARLARLGVRLAAALLDEDALDEVAELVDAGALDVVVAGDGLAHELPFELIRLPDQRVLATAPGVRMVRTIGDATVPPASPLPGPLKLLIAVGAPEHTSNPALEIETEMQAIVDVLGGVGRAEVTILEVAGPDEIAAALRRDAYHVLHLSAHGSPYGVELEDRDGNAVAVLAEDLVRVLRRGGRPLPLIVLSSCMGAADADAGLAVTLLRHGAERVVAMQTSVTDGYATRLLTGVYRALSEPGVPVAAAVAAARSALSEVVLHEAGDLPEYATPALFANVDGPLWTDDVPPVPLSNPTELPTGDGVRELALGDLVGRRPLLRRVSQILRDDVRAGGDGSGTGGDGPAALVGGVVLTGPAGIGKTAIAGRVLTRLQDDVDDPWTVAVQSGAWNPAGLVAELAAAGVDLGDTTDPAVALAAVGEAMRYRRILLFFDDFEQNLTVGGGAFLDPGFAEAFTALCAAAERGKVLVTSRYPVPLDVALERLTVPPLSVPELWRLVVRLPGLRGLAPEERELVVRAVGGHPRLVEFVDALVHGGARLPEVTARLRALSAGRRDAASGPADAGGSPVVSGGPAKAAEATREAIALGARDVLLTELLALLDDNARSTLRQLAVAREPVPAAQLAFAVLDREPTDAEVAEVDGHLDRLRDLTLADRVGDGALVEPWLREALGGDESNLAPAASLASGVSAGAASGPASGAAGRDSGVARGLARGAGGMGSGVTPGVASEAPGVGSGAAPDPASGFAAGLTVAERHRRAAAAGQRVAEPSFETVLEVVYHLRSAGRDDDLAGYAAAMSPRLAGQLTVAAFLGEILPGLPPAHPAYAGLLTTQRDALEASGSVAAAAELGERLVSRAERGAPVELSGALDAQGRLLRRLGRIAAARAAYERALAIDLELAEQDPADVALRRNVALSHTKLALAALDEGEFARARAAADEALRIRRELLAAAPEDGALRWDLAETLGTVGAVYRVTGSSEVVAAVGSARPVIESVESEADGGPVGSPAAGATTETATPSARSAIEAVDASAAVAGGAVSSAGSAGATGAGTGDLATSLAAHEEALGIWRSLLPFDETNGALLENLADTLGEVADLRRADAEAFRTLVTEASEIAQRLAAADGGNARYQRRLMTAAWRLGDMDLAAGDPTCAETHFVAALDVAERLAERDPGGVDTQRDLGLALRRMADWAVAAGRPEEIRGHLERSAEFAADLVHRFPRHGGLHVELAEARERLADCLRDAGERAAARALYRQALAGWRRRAVLDPEDTAAPLGEARVLDRLAGLAATRR